MPIPDEKEKKRIETLYSLNILHSQKEQRFDRITKAASLIFGLPIAGIGLIDTNTVVFKSIFGISIEETPRENSFSQMVLQQQNLVMVEDVPGTPEFSNSPLIKKGNIKFYAGVPLTTPDGHILGDFFVADQKAQKLNELQQAVLRDLSIWVVEELLKGKIFLEEQKMRNDLVSRNRELAREKARADAMLADIGDGVIGINDKGEIIFINQAVEGMTGYTTEDLVGKHLIQAIRMVDTNAAPVPASNQPIRQAIFYRKKVMSEQYYYVRKDEKKFPVALTATPVVVFDQVIGGVVIFRDITREKEIDRMKTEFISLASHQLRTPLSAMKWFCEILIDGDAGELNKEQAEMLTNIYKSNERMIELVNTLLNISRIESGRIIIDPKPTDLKKLVDDVVFDIGQRLEKRKHKLVISVHGQLPLISLDPKLIRHVYMNLLTNAIKYTPGGGEIMVIISRSGDNILSQVSDNGLGIPREQQDRVFKKFFRAENIVKIETEGTGLGLYLAKAIVESSGGKIWFKSEVGKGTSFWFSVPLNPIKQSGEVSIDS